MHLTRRYFLKSTGALGAYLGVSPLSAMRLVGMDDALTTKVTRNKTLVVVFLRGGADGLNLVVPYGDPSYSTLRRSLALAAPGQGGNAVIDLDGFFGLHPRLAGLKPHFDSGLIFGFKEDAGRFRLQATAGADFDGYTMSTLDVPSPIKDELWLLAKGRRHTFNGRLVRFRLYGFDGEAFRAIWSPDDMLGATERTTPEGFAITHDIKQRQPWYTVTDEYTLTMNGVVRLR